MTSLSEFQRLCCSPLPRLPESLLVTVLLVMLLRDLWNGGVGLDGWEMGIVSGYWLMVHSFHLGILGLLNFMTSLLCRHTNH